MTGEIAQSADLSSCQYVDLHLNPRYPCKKLGMTACIIPALGRQRLEAPWSSRAYAPLGWLLKSAIVRVRGMQMVQALVSRPLLTYKH